MAAGNRRRKRKNSRILRKFFACAVFFLFLGIWQILPNLSRIGTFLRESGERLEEIGADERLSWKELARNAVGRRRSGGNEKPSLQKNSDGANSAAEQESALVAGTVFHVSDGDTVDLRMVDGREVRLRFYGVDAPESAQNFGGEARKYVSGRLLSKSVEVLMRYDDQYGRSVSTIYLNGKDFSLELLENGYVWHYIQYCDDMAYANAQDRAKKAGKGLWGDAVGRGEEAIPPWTYRKLHPRKK